MKRLIALMTACLLLSLLPAMAEEPVVHTFMGIPWGATWNEATSVLMVNTNAGIHWADRNPNDVYLSEGFFKMLGMQLCNDGLCLSFDPDSRLLASVRCESIEYPLRGDEVTDEMNLNDLAVGNEVVVQLLGRYGTPDIACVDVNHTLYLVPEEELPYIVRDAAYLAKLCGDSTCYVTLVFGNVTAEVNIEIPGKHYPEYQQGSYSITITYQPELVMPEDVSYWLLKPERLKSIPILNGEIQFIIIEP